jgi:hypothetical protein
MTFHRNARGGGGGVQEDSVQAMRTKGEVSILSKPAIPVNRFQCSSEFSYQPWSTENQSILST